MMSSDEEKIIFILEHGKYLICWWDPEERERLNPKVSRKIELSDILKTYKSNIIVQIKKIYHYLVSVISLMHTKESDGKIPSNIEFSDLECL